MRRLALASLLLLAAAGGARPPLAADEPPSAPRVASERSIYASQAAWTDDQGRPVLLSDFGGRAVVLAMFYTSCPSACPIIVAAMKRFQAALPESVRARTAFVLVSIDSEHDTPAVLSAYRSERGLPKASWTLLRGDADSVRELALLLGEKYRPTGPVQFAHSNVITILNKSGEIAYQRVGLGGADSEVVEALVRADP